MTVSSFFSGHIRLRGEMIKDDDIFNAFKDAVGSLKAVHKIERKPKTGSLYIEYDAKLLPAAKFKAFKEELPELKKLSDSYEKGKIEKSIVIEKIIFLAEKLKQL